MNQAAKDPQKLYSWHANMIRMARQINKAIRRKNKHIRRLQRQVRRPKVKPLKWDVGGTDENGCTWELANAAGIVYWIHYKEVGGKDKFTLTISTGRTCEYLTYDNKQSAVNRAQSHHEYNITQYIQTQ